MDLSGSFADLDRDRHQTIEDTTRIEDILSRDSNSQSLGITLQYLYYSSPHKKLSLYSGSGPSVNISRFEDDQAFKQENPRGRVEGRAKTEESGWSAGLSSVLGVEWFINSRLSLLAENRFLIGYNY